MKTIEDICWHFNIAKTERILNNGKNVGGYLEVGCYDCSGYNVGCKYYSPQIKKYKEDDKF